MNIEPLSIGLNKLIPAKINQTIVHTTRNEV